MRIESINIRNFRGFEDESFEFDPNMTVVVGKNTTGKTTLLKAVQIALGAYLKSLRGLPEDKAYRMNFAKSDIYKRYDREKKDFIANNERTRIDVEAVFPETICVDDKIELGAKPIRWWRELRGTTTTHNKECAGELIKCVNTMEENRDSRDPDQNAIYPLVLSFGVRRIDNDYRSANKTIARQSRIERAYKSALLETVDFKSAFDWLYRYDSNYDKGLEFEGTREAFMEALTTAIPALSQIDVDSKNSEFRAVVSVTDEDPEYQTFANMSDGFKAVICIVAEMAYRCVELNGFLGRAAVKQTPGVVVIDEVDLYLHPRWQRHILAELQAAFPLIQFIVSSHSPYIVQSVANRNIITLDGRLGSSDANMRSIEEITLSEMGMKTRRSAKYDRMLDSAEEYYQLVKKGLGDSPEAEAVRQRLNEIEDDFSDDPAYVAMLRMERSVKDEAVE